MKSTWVLVLLSLTIGFSLGVTFGKFSSNKQDRKCHNCASKQHCKNGHYGKHKKMKEKMLAHFSSELNLNEEQKVKVAAIFESKHKEMMKIREELHPKFKALHKSAHDDINNILTSEQQKKFEELDAKFKSFRKKRHPGCGD